MRMRNGQLVLENKTIKVVDGSWKRLRRYARYRGVGQYPLPDL